MQVNTIGLDLAKLSCALLVTWFSRATAATMLGAFLVLIRTAIQV